MHMETEMPVELNDKPMLSSIMCRSYPTSGILPIHPSDFMDINGYNGQFLTTNEEDIKLTFQKFSPFF